MAKIVTRGCVDLEEVGCRRWSMEDGTDNAKMEEVQ